MSQTNITINNKTINTSTDLIIGKQAKQELSKQQQTFNKVVKRIEKLRRDLLQNNEILNKKLDFYVQNVYPLEQQMTTLRKENVKILYKFFADKKVLSKKQKEILREAIVRQFSDILKAEPDAPDEELREIFRAIEGVTFEEASKEDFDAMKNEMAEMFEEFGFDMDLDAIHSDMTEEEVIKKMAELNEQLRQKTETNEQNPSSKKSKKQQQKEQKEKLLEEARTKSISTIYRQLAKAFHPDLEQDEELKIEKEHLMKELTAAYEKNDLHTLLRLEISWIQKEENNPDKLTDEKLKIYNEALKEQVRELEDEIQILLQHPRFQPLQKYALFPHMIKEVNIEREKFQAEYDLKEMAESVRRLKLDGKEAITELKNIIRAQQTHSQLDGYFNTLMS